MAFVKTFRVHPQFGVPDKDIAEFVKQCEEDFIVNVSMIYIPAYGIGPDGTSADPRITVVVTKLDDKMKE